MVSSVKSLAKRVLQSIAPTAYAGIAAARARAYNQRSEERFGCTKITHALADRYGLSVLGGPFEGVRFPEELRNRHLGPKIVGTYEMELFPSIESIRNGQYRQIIDVGCAEGYYAIGLARLFPHATVHAFDTDRWARRMTTRMAELNAVSNVVVHQACTPGWLNQHVQSGAFILSDCEGYEDTLLDPDKAPALAACDILVETHEVIVPGVEARLRQRFGATHTIDSVEVQRRNARNHDRLLFLKPEDRDLAVNELRHNGQAWLFLRAMQPGAGGTPGEAL